MRVHYVGVAGIGMSALAQYHCLCGHDVSGSDRQYDKDPENGIFKKLKSLGISLFEQNGNGITRSTDLVVISPAVEKTNPDRIQAEKLGIPISFRTEVLSTVFNDFKIKLAVAGTSGKTSVSAMLAHCLNALGVHLSAFIGGVLCNYKGNGLGNYLHGNSGVCVIEADESDGRLDMYKPDYACINSLSIDHLELDEMKDVVCRFAENVKESIIVNGDSKELVKISGYGIPVTTFGMFEGNDYFPENIVHKNGYIKFHINDVEFSLKGAGEFFVKNSMAVCALLKKLGYSLEDISGALRTFQGVKRRMEILGTENGVTVIDDYAHNPEKIQAAINAAKSVCSGKLWAVYQPHGFAPTRLMWSELVKTFSDNAKDADSITLLDVYYAGGSVNKDFTSNDIVQDVKKVNCTANIDYSKKRDDFISRVCKHGKDGDVVLIMGARDSSLTDFGKYILEKFKQLTRYE